MTDTTKMIAELEELMAKATLGEWKAEGRGKLAGWGSSGKHPGFDGRIVSLSGQHIVQSGSFVPVSGATPEECEANARLIVAMRNALPELIAGYKRLQDAVNIETAGHDNTSDELAWMEGERDAALARAEKAKAERNGAIRYLSESHDLPCGCGNCPIPHFIIEHDPEDGCERLFTPKECWAELFRYEAAKRGAGEVEHD